MSYKHTDSYIEKTFLYLLVLSFLLHVAMFLIFKYFPEEKKVAKEEPVMVELQDLPPSMESPAPEQKEVKRFAEKRRRVAREMAPKGLMDRERITAQPKWRVPPAAQPQGKGRETAPWQPPERERGTAREMQPGEDLLIHRKPEPSNLAKLFPKAEKMARLEENYRKKYGPEVEEGDVAFLNTNDILFGSFLRRFENAIYGVWRYPEEAASRGIQGEAAVMITFNRKGEVENYEILEGSGSAILDNEIRRTLRLVGPMGALPKGYTKEKYHLLASFRYTLSGGMTRSLQ